MIDLDFFRNLCYNFNKKITHDINILSHQEKNTLISYCSYSK